MDDSRIKPQHGPIGKATARHSAGQALLLTLALLPWVASCDSVQPVGKVPDPPLTFHDDSTDATHDPSSPSVSCPAWMMPCDPPEESEVPYLPVSVDSTELNGYFDFLPLQLGNRLTYQLETSYSASAFGGQETSLGFYSAEAVVTGIEETIDEKGCLTTRTFTTEETFQGKTLFPHLVLDDNRITYTRVGADTTYDDLSGVTRLEEASRFISVRSTEGKTFLGDLLKRWDDGLRWSRDSVDVITNGPGRNDQTVLEFSRDLGMTSMRLISSHSGGTYRASSALSESESGQSPSPKVLECRESS